MPDPVSPADQIKALSDTLTTLQAAHDNLAGDVNRRFEQQAGDVNRRFDQMTASLDNSVATLTKGLDDLAIKSLAHKQTIAILPALNGSWLAVGGSNQMNPVGIVNPAPFIVAGGMPISLPNLCRVQVFRADFDFHMPGGIAGGSLVFAITRSRPNQKAESVVELATTVTSTGLEGNPIPGTEIVDNERFSYQLTAALVLQPVSVFPPNFQPIPISQATVVLIGFQVDCIVG